MTWRFAGKGACALAQLDSKQNGSFPIPAFLTLFLPFPKSYQPTTDELLGTRKWSAGPSGVILFMSKPWVIGALVRQLVSFAGNDDRKDVSQLLMQPIVNYNLPGGWYLKSSPVITANWEAAGGQKWNVPIGGGFGRLMKISKRPVNTSAQAFYHVEHPTNGAEWAFQFQVQFLFPK